MCSVCGRSVGFLMLAHTLCAFPTDSVYRATGPLLAAAQDCSSAAFLFLSCLRLAGDIWMLDVLPP